MTPATATAMHKITNHWDLDNKDFSSGTFCPLLNASLLGLSLTLLVVATGNFLLDCKLLIVVCWSGACSLDFSETEKVQLWLALRSFILEWFLLKHLKLHSFYQTQESVLVITPASYFNVQIIIICTLKNPKCLKFTWLIKAKKYSISFPSINVHMLYESYISN